MINETKKTRPEDIWEPEMPMTWLVRDTKAFGLSGQVSTEDRSVELRITYHEWLAIYFDALGIDRSGYDQMAAKRAALGQPEALLSELGEVVPDFPILSRIQGPFHDAVFEADEIATLREECLQVQAKTSNPVALEGIRKLLVICDQAQKLGLSIYLVSNAS